MTTQVQLHTASTGMTLNKAITSDKIRLGKKSVSPFGMRGIIDGLEAFISSSELIVRLGHGAS